MEQLTTRRRRAWIPAISRSDLTDDKLEHERVCYRHFVSRPSRQITSRPHEETAACSVKSGNVQFDRIDTGGQFVQNFGGHFHF